MGACLSSSGNYDVSDEEKKLHKEAEQALKEVSLTYSTALARFA
jgi:hypothetical protein